MYRSLKNLSFYESLADKQLKGMANRRKNIFVMGDLNTDLSPRGSNNTMGKSLKRVLNRNGLVHVNVIKDYTCITECTKSLIDLFITSIKSKVKLCGTFDTSIEDHRLNYCVLDLFRKSSPADPRTVIVWKKLILKVKNATYRLFLGM